VCTLRTITRSVASGRFRSCTYPAFTVALSISPFLADKGKKTIMSAISETNCFYHPDRTAMGNCTECRQPICLGCETQTAGKTVCQQCVAAIRQRIAAAMSTDHAAPPSRANTSAYAQAPYPAEGGVYQVPHQT
jgi:hypothetical protein